MTAALRGELHAYLAADTTPAPRKHVYGPGCWCRPIRDDVGALVHGDVDMEAEGARHLDTVRSLVASARATVEAVRERDEARAEVKRLQRTVRIAKDTETVLRGEVRYHVAAGDAFEEQVVRADKAEAALDRVRAVLPVPDDLVSTHRDGCHERHVSCLVRTVRAALDGGAP